MKYLPAASACTRQPNWIKSQRHKTLGWLRAHAQGGSHSLTHSHAPRKSARENLHAQSELLSRPSNFSCSLYTQGRRCALASVRQTHVWLSFPKSNTLAARCWPRWPSRPPRSATKFFRLRHFLRAWKARWPHFIPSYCSRALSYYRLTFFTHPMDHPTPPQSFTQNFLLFHACAIYRERISPWLAPRLNAVRAFCGSINIIIRATQSVVGKYGP